MKTLSINGKEHGIVEVPEEGSDFEIYQGELIYDLPNNSCDGKKLPKGNWKILGEITREGNGNIRINFHNEDGSYTIPESFKAAIESQTGILFKNPMEKPAIKEKEKWWDGAAYVVDKEKWKSYEKQLLRKDSKLLVLGLGL